jgi:uncharacterized integral membrane protein
MKGSAAHMKSYILTIVVVMILSAVYALSNTAEITVQFLTLQTTFPQGLWEVIVFACGVLIMGIASISASVETYVKNRKKGKELTKRIAQLEDERKSLLGALTSFGWKSHDEGEPQGSSEPNSRREEASVAAKTVYDPDSHRAPEHPREPEGKVVLDKRELSGGTEPRENAEVKPSFLAKLISSISSVFKREKKPEAANDATEAEHQETESQMSGQENVCSCSIPEFESEPEPESAGEGYAAQAVTKTEEKEKSEI